MSAKVLKLIAAVTMIIDHAASAIVLNLIRNRGLNELISLYKLMRNIGRIAFPIYIFLLIEGFVHTSNIRKYLTSLLIFAFISELPFDLALGKGQIINTGSQNVYISLFLGMLCLCCLEYISEHFLLTDTRRYMMYAAATALFAFAALFIRCDYKWGGILAIVFTYMVYVCNKGCMPERLSHFIMGLICCMTLMIYNDTEKYAFIALLPIILYNGQRGKIKFKYLYYAIYPVHLLVLGIIIRIYGIV